MARTLYDKLYDDHFIASRPDGLDLLYIDLHLVHEVTSPQAFATLKQASRPLWRPASVVATMDHVTPTDPEDPASRSGSIEDIVDPVANLQLRTLRDNCTSNELRLYDFDSSRQGIVHVIGPEQGFTQPGMTVVCGDSHTSTHGALGTLATGIGTSEVAHVLASQCLLTRRQKNMRVCLTGCLPPGVFSKDIILYVIGQIGINGGSGYAIEFTGEAIEKLSIEARMTLCNMSIEAGSRNGLVGVDATTIDYVASRPFAPKGRELAQAERHWQHFATDDGAVFDRSIELDVNQLSPQITWGTSPDMVVDVDGHLPALSAVADPVRRDSMAKAYEYMGLEPGAPVDCIELDQIFIGSCTNSRIEDLRQVAQIVAGQKVSRRIKRAMIVPGSKPVQMQAEQEGLADIFVDAGFEWRRPGCSMCLAMNPDRLEANERCASTSNRNFEGRQGRGGRTHLVSPASAAMAALSGRFADVRAHLKDSI
ncbi:MAG: 3-isopropylmalate dehydratase large subunit [Gammaproteobacteria bacterium]